MEDSIADQIEKKEEAHAFSFFLFFFFFLTCHAPKRANREGHFASLFLFLTLRARRLRQGSSCFISGGRRTEGRTQRRTDGGRQPATQPKGE